MTYSFPNISFKEDIIGPGEVRRPWRDTIGVAGLCRKGPLGPREIDISSGKNEFVSLYGIDDSALSLFVQQCSAQGANRFVVSRAVAGNVPGNATITLQNSNPLLPAQVGQEGLVNDLSDYTTGLNLSLNYIGSPAVYSTLGVNVKTQKAQIGHSSFQGRAKVHFYVSHHEKPLIDSYSSDPIIYTSNDVPVTYVTNHSADKPSIALFPKSNVNAAAFAAAIKPGRVAAPSLASLQGPNPHLILSEVFDYDTDNYGFVVSLSQEPILATVSTNVTNNAIVNVVPISGTLEIGQQVKFAGNTLSYTINAIQPGASPGTFDITLNIPITVSQNTVVSVPALTSDTVIESSLTSYYAIGYYFQSLDGSSLNDPSVGAYFQGRFSIPNKSNLPLDGYFLIPEDASAGFKTWNYLVRPDANTPLQLDTDLLNLSVDFDQINNIYALRVGGYFVVPIARSSVEVKDLVPGTYSDKILLDLEKAIYQNQTFTSLIRSVKVQTVTPPYSINLTSALIGDESERVYWDLTRTVEGDDVGADDLLFNGGNTSKYGSVYTFSGGIDAPNYAKRIFYSSTGVPLLLVSAVSPGALGNKIQVTINPQDEGRFTLTVVDVDSANYLSTPLTETFSLDNSLVDSATGLYGETLNSKLIRAFFLPVEELSSHGREFPESYYNLTPTRTLPAFELQNPILSSGDAAIGSLGVLYVTNIPLQGGSEPSTSDSTLKKLQEAEGILEAVKLLEQQDVTFIVAPDAKYGDSSYSAIFKEMKEQSQRSTPLNGLRMAVFDTVKGLNGRQALVYADIIDSERVVLLSGHSTFTAQKKVAFNSVPASGYYAGLVVSRPPHISPPSTWGGTIPQGVVSVETPNDPNYLNQVTIGRTELLHFDSGIRAFKFLNGLTTSRNPNYKYVSVRRLMDQILSDLYFNLQWSRSENNTRALQARVAAACDAYLQQKLREEYIVRVAPTICGPENNSFNDMVNGILNVRIRLTPVYPADFIRVNVIRDLTENFSLTTAVA